MEQARSAENLRWRWFSIITALLLGGSLLVYGLGLFTSALDGGICLDRGPEWATGASGLSIDVIAGEQTCTLHGTEPYAGRRSEQIAIPVYSQPALNIIRGLVVVSLGLSVIWTVGLVRRTREHGRDELP